MTNLVVDSSVVVKWLTIEPFSSEALKILNDYQVGAVNLLAPDLINAEVGNIIWKKHVFQGISAIDAQLMLDVFRRLDFVLTPTNVLLETAYHLAITHQRTVYDMLYVALSVRSGCQFVTADEKLVNAISKTFPSVIWIANWA